MKKKTIGKNFSEIAGFTLIELLITIFLISVGLIGVISFFNTNLQSQFEAKNEVIAAGLAQEATELVRNIVDYNFLNDNTKWYTEIAVDQNGTSNCDWLDVESLTNHKCWNSSDNYKFIGVCIDILNGQYYQCQNVGNENRKYTDFLRKVVAKGENVNDKFELPNGIDLDAGDCLKVEATVGWPKSNAACANDIAMCPQKTTSTDIICKPRL
ncbi:MAG: hypothetical protein A2359_04780 [Candidatus Moranbacteria bacterium RIFOXYB1_FULL_43_19]|nr:MAG: hypothetical protein A2359_04780 [Candidatus Moranbacteria bacterium RIFOXYB1_FULL_43_19]OGI28180.1 MAG: hypothetical protein A2184_00505 [Candidatus Moranbacteria bacterium RIFOXYA1_FULL_44_7]OGI33920.1 MAG: hypothetical protein A2420_01885 [Candidatus Moranbacteria bacterium RIFOXYC1_FULL_44_13]OGI38052.1 MAG: hypothetical protein A2612_02100 [Candidatus Moranbacteria bacterium RIFOXYD1_FULL_44_12]